MTKFHYKCNDCGSEFEESQIKYLCPHCEKSNSAQLPPKGVLKTVYDYAKLIEDKVSFDSLSRNGFIDLLPIKDVSSLPNLRVGNTPLYHIDKIENSQLPFNLFVKDDSQNPTYSFKDRASSVVSAYAKEHGYQTIVAASTGNAGSSIAGICASQQQQAIVVVPESAPLAKLTQILMYGAKLIPVKGTYDDAFDLSIKATEEFGWYNRNTAFNPLTIEGKKTVSFEIFGQLNESLPDRIFVPVGDGVIISGVYKGFEDLLNLNIIDKMPTIVAVQAEKSNNLIRNVESTDFEIEKSNTLADSISVDIPRNFFMAKAYLKKYSGETISVTDEEIINASQILSKNTGLFAEPAAAAAFAGMLRFKKEGFLTSNSNNVVLLTGSGLKDLGAVRGLLKMPDAVTPNLENLKQFLL